VRKVGDPNKNSSCVLIIMDSRRETHLSIGEYFTDEIIGRNEIMASEDLLNYLGIKPKNKEQIEIYFDILSMFKSFGITTREN